MARKTIARQPEFGLPAESFALITETLCLPTPSTPERMEGEHPALVPGNQTLSEEIALAKRIHHNMTERAASRIPGQRSRQRYRDEQSLALHAHLSAIIQRHKSP